MKRSLTIYLFFFGTLLSCLSSAWSGISAQTQSSGTPTPADSWPALASEHLLLTLGLALCCVVGTIMMVKNSWMSNSRGGKTKRGRRRHKDKNNRDKSPFFNRVKRKFRWPDSPVHGGDSGPLPPPKDQIPLPGDDDDDSDDGRGELPPPSDQIPLPIPDDDKRKLPPGDAPALPSAAFEAFDQEGDVDNATLGMIEAWAKKWFKGPLNPRSPLPWDNYIYPETPAVSEDAIATYDRVQWLCEKIKQWSKRPRKDKDKPPPDDRLLPAFVGPSDPGAAGLKDALREFSGPSPLEMLQQYLDNAGIRYFSAHELCRHNWFKTSVARKQVSDKIRDINGRRISGWGCVFDVLPPNHKLVFAIPTYIVPDPRMWPAIIPVLRVVDRYRHWLKKPVRGVSGYRHPWYNKAIGGSQPKIRNGKKIPGSYHMEFAAFDFSYGINTKNGDIDARMFKRFFWALYRLPGSGMGAYHAFIHVDYDRGRDKVPGKFLRWIHRVRKEYKDVFDKNERFNFVGSK